MKKELRELLESVGKKEREVIQTGNGPLDSLYRYDVLFFFIMTHIKGYLPDVQAQSVEEIQEWLGHNEATIAEELYRQWDYWFKNYSGEVVGVHNLVSEFGLNSQKDWDSLELAKFLTSEYLLFYPLNKPNDRAKLTIVDHLSDKLHLPRTRKDVLVYTERPDVMHYLVMNFASGQMITIVVDKMSEELKKLRFFFEDFKDIKIIEGGLDQLKEESNGHQYDFVIVGEATKDIRMKDILPFVTEDGLMICAAQSVESVSKWGRKEFHDYRTPIIFSDWNNGEQDTVVCVKSPVIEERIQFFNTYVFYPPYVEEEEFVNWAMRDYSHHKTSDVFVEVEKADFLYHDKLDFYSLMKARQGRENYVWKSIDDVFELQEPSNLTFEVSDDQIVTCNDLSKNAFNLELNGKYYLTVPSECDADFLDDMEYVHSGFILEKNSGYRITTNEEYLAYFKGAFGDEEHEDKEACDSFAQCLTSRLITSDAIISEDGKYVIVHATPEHPVAIQYFKIEKDPWDEYNVACRMKVYSIREGYDAHHVLHQFLREQDGHKGYVLIAPDLESQKADYAQKMDAHIKDLQRKRAEEEAELGRLGIRNAVADLAHMLGTTFARQGATINLIRLCREQGRDISDEKLETLMNSVEYVTRAVQNFGGDFEHTEFKWQNVNVKDLLTDYCKEWTDAMGKRFASQVTSNDCDDTIIESDPFYLKIMLDSIFENAWRHGFLKTYSEDNKVLVELSRVTYNKGHYLLMRISNNGQPLPMDIDMDAYISRGRFSATSGRSGLGGNHVYQIVKKHNGFMHIKSNDSEWPFAIDIFLPIVSPTNDEGGERL